MSNICCTVPQVNNQLLYNLYALEMEEMTKESQAKPMDKIANYQGTRQFLLGYHHSSRAKTEAWLYCQDEGDISSYQEETGSVVKQSSNKACSH